jgi:hypothetical protein
VKTLAQVIAEHVLCDDVYCTCGWSPSLLDPMFVQEVREHWAAHVAAAYRTARTITTADALSHPPAGAIARDQSGDTWLHYPNGWDNLSEDGTAGSYDDSALTLPVYVFYVPGDEKAP